MTEKLPARSKWSMQGVARITFLVAAGFAFVMAALPNPPRIPGQPADKVLHMLAFATLGGLAAVGFRGKTIGSLFAALAAFGAAIEIVQAIPMLNRDSDLADWLVDMAAALAALVCARGLLAWHARRRGRQAP